MISQRATALEPADHHQRRRLQRKARRQREHHDLGEHAQHPQPGDRHPAEAGGLPGDGGEGVVGGVAALNQRRADDDGEKAGITQQRARAVRRRRRRLRMVQPPARPRLASAPSPATDGDDPDQVPRRDDVDQEPAGQRADDEGRRPPQPQRPVIEPVTRHAAQRIGVRQRHHRRPHARRGGVGDKHQKRPMLGADDAKSERGGKGRDDDGAAQRPDAVRQARSRPAGS